MVAAAHGRALVATGSPFDDVRHRGRTHTISRANSIYVFPGLGTGALVANATSVTDAMLRAAALAVADTSTCRPDALNAGLLPPLSGVREVSRIALAVAGSAHDGGVGDDVDDDELARRIDVRWWFPDYPSFERDH